MSSSINRSVPSSAAVLAVLPTLGLWGGALLDERRNLGFTNWAAACRAGGASLQSILVFTRELLPSAIVGLLAGGLLIVLAAVITRHNSQATRSCLAAHAGCALSMPLMLPVCALALSPAITLAMDALLGALATVFALRLMTRRPRAVAAHP
jgi:hypothetical protein